MISTNTFRYHIKMLFNKAVENYFNAFANIQYVI